MDKNWKAERLLAGEIIISKEAGNSMHPVIKSKQPVELTPCSWEDVEPWDIVYCKVKGNYYTHFVKATNPKKGVLIGNKYGGINGWTKKVYGKVTKIIRE